MPTAFPTATEVYYGGEVVYLPIWKNKDGTSISNSAKALYYKPFYEPTNVAIMHLLFFTKSFSATKHREWSNAVNDSQWGPWDKKCAWASIVNATPLNDNTSDGHNVHVVVRCYRESWQLKFAQMGWFYKDGTDYKPFLDYEDNRYLGKLDDTGGQLAMDSDPVIAEEDIKHEIDFATAFNYTPT